MNDNTVRVDEIENEIFADDVSDETMEAAAGMSGTPAGLPCTAGPFLAPTFGSQPC